MAHDFAKHKQPSAKAKRRMPAVSRTQPAPSSHWGWYFSGFLSGIVTVAIAWFGLVRLDELRTTPGETVAGNVEITTPDIAFDFYSALANSEVTVTESPVTSEPPATPAAPATVPVDTPQAQRDSQVYLVQAGSFLARQDAENLRANLILLNLNSSISQGVVNGRTVYRVQAGPYTGRASAEETRELLSNNGIDSMLLRPL